MPDRDGRKSDLTEHNFSEALRASRSSGRSNSKNDGLYTVSVSDSTDNHFSNVHE